MEVNGAVFVGLATLDLAYTVDRYPAEDTKTQAAELFLGAGGPAANAAVAYAHLAGHSPTLITALGEHPLAEPIRDDLHRYGVALTDLTPDAATRPPVSSIVVATAAATRTIVSLDGSRADPRLPAGPAGHAATGTVAPEHAGPGDRFEEIAGPGSDAAAAELLGNAAIVLVDGHYAEPALRIAAAARAAGIPVVLDAGRWRQVHAELLPLVDIAICSAAFAPPGVPPGSAAEVFDFLHTAGPAYAAITNGAEPIRYSFRGTDPGVPSAARAAAGSPDAEATGPRVLRPVESVGDAPTADGVRSGVADGSPGMETASPRTVRDGAIGSPDAVPDVAAGSPDAEAAAPRAVPDGDGARRAGGSGRGPGRPPVQGETACARGEVAVPKVAAVDTLGAGDILHGAFCHFHALGEAFPVALRHAAEVAALSCASVGTRGWMGGQTIL
ncbi:PfkB family carbohydrate kinase [Nocardia sp. NPDC005978]|uniref:PfkB family carbohydrate kinase n=1 Tax=Nocardia sp. NPDC005978 TaxID=3156725 RepID=UPI0033B0E764